MGMLSSYVNEMAHRCPFGQRNSLPLGRSLPGGSPRHRDDGRPTIPAATVEKVKAIVLEKIEKMKKGEIGEDEFARAKKIAVAEKLMSNQTNTAQAQAASINELYGLGYDFDAHYAERINAVTIDDVIRVANKYLTHYVCVVATPKPEETTEATGE